MVHSYHDRLRLVNAPTVVSSGEALAREQRRHDRERAAQEHQQREDVDIQTSAAAVAAAPAARTARRWHSHDGVRVCCCCCLGVVSHPFAAFEFATLHIVRIRKAVVSCDRGKLVVSRGQNPRFSDSCVVRGLIFARSSTKCEATSNLALPSECTDCCNREHCYAIAHLSTSSDLWTTSVIAHLKRKTPTVDWRQKRNSTSHSRISKRPTFSTAIGARWSGFKADARLLGDGSSRCSCS